MALMDMASAAKRKMEKEPTKGMPARLPAEFKQPMLDLFAMLRAQSMQRDLRRWSEEDDDDSPHCCYGGYGQDSDLAEKLVGSFGKGMIKPAEVCAKMAEYLKTWGDDGQKSEEAVLSAVQDLHAMAKGKTSSLGLEKLLMNMADEHENALYASERKS